MSPSKNDRRHASNLRMNIVRAVSLGEAEVRKFRKGYRICGRGSFYTPDVSRGSGKTFELSARAPRLG